MKLFKRSVFAAVVKLLLKVVIIVYCLIVNNLAVLLNRNYVRVDETTVRFKVQGLIISTCGTVGLTSKGVATCVHGFIASA